MRRLPPRSTRTDTLFPYTTLFRSIAQPGGDDQAEDHRPHRAAQQAVRIGHVIEIERHHHGCTGLDPHLLNPQDCEREETPIDELAGYEQRPEPRCPWTDSGSSERRCEMAYEHD